MNLGEVVIILAAVASIGAAALRYLGARTKDKRFREISATLSIFTFLLVSAALFILLYYFIISDMDYRYVWSYSSTETSTLYRVSGLWAGAAGSFLLWIWMMSLVQVVEVVLEPRRKYLSRKFHDVLQISLASVVFVFLLLMMDMGVFGRTGAAELASYPSGYGLSLALQTPEMVVHPPVVFAGYAFCVAALAAALGYNVTGERNWFMVALPWTRLAWVFLTLGIGIGAIWAYYVLGWGGYWGWDPVETASLLPWLMATAFLHSVVRNAKKDEYPVVAPTLGILSFASVAFATFATRAGGIWSSSVHSFDSAGSTSSGLERLGELLDKDAVILGLFVLMLALLALAFTYAIQRHRGSPSVEGEAPPRLSDYVSDKNNMLLTIVLLIVTSAVMLLLLFKNVDVAQAANYSEFNQKMSVFFVAVSVTLSVCLIWKLLGKDRALWFGIGVVGLSVVVGVVAMATGFANGLVAFSAPSYAVVIGASVVRMSRSRVPGSLRKSLQQVSPHVMHLGVAFVLLAYVVSSTMQAYPEVEGQAAKSGVVVPVGGNVSVGDYTVMLISLNIREESINTGGSHVTEALEATVNVLRDGKVIESGVVLTNLYGTDGRGNPAIVEIEVHVYKSALRDLYLNFEWRSADTALIEVKTMPLMNVLWAGLGLLAVGLALRFASWQFEPKAAPARSPRPGEAGKKSVAAQSRASTATEGKDYEALVEEELRKFKEKKGK